jgi:hypothetical protein
MFAMRAEGIGAYRRHAEWRKKPRRVLGYTARIALGKDRPLVPCRIADISEGGALLRLARADAVPPLFALLLTATGDARRFCQVVRRDGTMLGVRFIAAL